MTAQQDDLSDRDRRLGEIVFAYLQAVENGECPCRRELISRHPEFATELNEFLADRDRFDRIAAPIRRATQAIEPSPTLGMQAETTAQRATAAPGGMVGGYELLEELGRGGMGVVYKARQTSLNRLVALKMIRPDRLPSPSDVERFRREAEAVAALDHPNIASIYEVGEHEGRSFYTMKLIEGGGLDKNLARLRDDPAAAVRLLAAVASAICHAHRRGILHRDLKPSNILIDADGRPYITDFGLARHVQEDLSLTQTGELLGTPPYMAPEQLRGGKSGVTSSTDIYGLGAVLYTMLTGRPPFAGKSVYEVLDRIAARPPAPPSQLNPRVDRDVQTICLKCLEKDPQKRYSCAGELLDDLQRWLAGQPIRARPIGRVEQARRWCRRYPLAVGLAALAALLMVVVIASLVVSRIRIARHQEVTERHLYAANIRLANLAWNNSDLAQTLKLLAACRPAPGHADLRGFEWYYLWGVAHGEAKSLPGHSGDVYCAVFASDGRTLASAGKDCTARIWDAATGEMLHTLRGHADEVNNVAFSPDGANLASASDDRTVKLWDPRTGALRATLTGHAGGVGTVAFSPDGQTVASGGRDHAILLWDAHTGQRRAELRGHTDYVDSLAFAPDGKTLASAGRDDLVRLWDLAALKETARLDGHPKNVLAVAFAHSGRRIATASEDATIVLWDAATHKGQVRLRDHQSWVQSLDFSADDRLLVSASKDGTVRIWDIEAEREVAQVVSAHVGRVWSAAFSPDGKSLATTGADGAIKLWDRTTFMHQERVPLPLESRIGSVAFSPDGKSLATAGGGLFDVAKGVEPRGGPADAKQIFEAAFSPEGSVLAASDGQGTVVLRDPGTGQLLAILGRHGAQVRALAFSPDGQTLATTAHDPTIWLWDVATRSRRAVLRGHGVEVDCLAFSPKGDLLASGAREPGVRFWDPASGEEKAGLPGVPSPVSAVAFSPDGKTLATGGTERTIRLWDVATGRESAALLGHVHDVQALAYSPDGRRLASGSLNESVKLWDTVTGGELLNLDGPAAGTWCLAFSPDGTVLAAGGAANRRWPASAYLWFAPRQP